MFSFAIWDKQNKNLVLIRDPYGKKPLLYLIKNRNIFFASDLNSLEKIIDCGEINPLAVESLFKLRLIHDPLTIYKNVFKLSAGSILKFSKQEVSIKKWYNLHNSSLASQSKTRFKNNIIELFDKAVKRRLVSDVDVGVFYLETDSSLIVSSLAEQGYSLPCFDRFENSSHYYEERPQANRLAKYFGMESHTLKLMKR